MRRKALVGLAGLLVVAVIVALAMAGGGGVPGESAEPAAAETSGAGSGAGRPGSDVSSMALDATRGGDGVGMPAGSSSPSGSSNGGAPSKPGPGGGPLPPLPSPDAPLDDVVDDVVDEVCTEAERAAIAQAADDLRADLEDQIDAKQSELDALSPLLVGLIDALRQEISDLESELASVDDVEEDAIAVCEAGGDGLSVF